MNRLRFAPKLVIFDVDGVLTDGTIWLFPAPPGAPRSTDAHALQHANSAGYGIVSRYMERAHRAASKDPVVLRRFFEVASLLAPPPAMMAPRIAWRVLVGGRGRRQTSPAQKLALS